MLERHAPVGVIQMWAIAPAPDISARTFTSPGSITTYGATFHPRPSFRAGLFAGSGSAIAPLPFSPVGFSGLIERLSAFDRIARLPMYMPSPLKDAIAIRLLVTSRAILVRSHRDAEGFEALRIRDRRSRNRDRRRGASESAIAARRPPRFPRSDENRGLRANQVLASSIAE